MDGMQRRNAGVGIDDKVGLRKALARPAEKVSLAPTEPIRIMGGEQYMAQVLQGRAITRGDVISVSVMGRKFDFVVTSFQPGADAVLVEASTDIKIAEKAMKEEEAKVPKVDYEDIGGLGEEVRKVREMIELPLRHPELFERLGVEAPKGVLLHGPPGTGKTLLAKAVASETNANFHSISGPEIMSKFYGQSEENLRDMFKKAEENAPSIIFIDEIDSIAPKRDEVAGEVERRVVAQLLALMDGLQARGKVVVIGATNRPNALDPALRRPGRFDREIEIGVPDRDGRLEILQIHTRGMPLSKDVDLKELAGLTHGYVGADLAALSKEAAMRSLRRILPDIDLQADVIPPEILNRLTVTRDDFLQAYREMEPSTLREVLIEKPNVRWEDIGGLDEAKQELRESIEWPLRMNKVFAHFDARPPRGIIIFGPPGTGKTLMMPRSGRASKCANTLFMRSGHSIDSRSSCFASSRPPMSSHRTLGFSIRTSRSVDGSISRYACRKSSRVTVRRFRISGGITSAWRSMSGRMRRSDRMAASFERAARSAPTYPWVRPASSFRSTSFDRGMPRVWIWRISSRPSRSGTPISISRSNRPGRRSAGSSAFGRFVAPMTTTLPRACRPSIRASSCATTRRSTSPATSSRFGAIESSSSMKMMLGASSSACLKMSRRFSSLCP